MKRHLFKLFITGDRGKSREALNNLRKVCDEKLGDNYDIVVIDVLERPAAAEENLVIATPMLVRVEPAPQRRVVGDLSDKSKVYAALDIE